MGFDVVVVTSISSEWFNAIGIDNGDDIDNFDGAGHSVEENLSLATWHSSDPKVWLTESAFASARESLTIPTIANYCHGVVGSGYLRSERRGRHYVYYFNEDAIIREFCVHGDVKTKTCEDGSKVVTHQCIPPDFVATGDTCETCVRLAAKRTKTCLDGTTIATHDCVDGKWVATGAECGDGCVDGTTKTRTCADGSTIVSHECVQGVWYESDNKCPEDEEEEPECTEDEIKECADGSTIITKQCIEGVYVPTSNRCPEEPEPSKSPWVLLTVAIIGLYLYLRG